MTAKIAQVQSTTTETRRSFAEVARGPQRSTEDEIIVSKSEFETLNFNQMIISKIIFKEFHHLAPRY